MKYLAENIFFSPHICTFRMVFGSIQNTSEPGGGATQKFAPFTLNKILVKVTHIIGRSWSELVVICQKSFLSM